MSLSLFTCLSKAKKLQQKKQTRDDPSMFRLGRREEKLLSIKRPNASETFTFNAEKQGERVEIRDRRCRAKWPSSTLTETVIAASRQTSLPSECECDCECECGIQQLIISRALTNIILNWIHYIVFSPFILLILIDIHNSRLTCRVSHVVSLSFVCLLFATDDAYEGISSLL